MTDPAGGNRNGPSTSTSNQQQNIPPLMKREEEEANKDRSLAQLLGMLDGYRPVIPDEVAQYYLQKSGVDNTDPRLNRLLSISAERFIDQIVSSSYQYSRIRSNATAGRPSGSGANATSTGATGGAGGQQDKSRTVLTMDDVRAACADFGIDAGHTAEGFK